MNFDIDFFEKIAQLYIDKYYHNDEYPFDLPSINTDVKDAYVKGFLDAVKMVNSNKD